MRIWMALHLGLTVALPFLFSLLLGCMKLPEKGEATLGPAVSEAEMQKLIDKALADVDPLKVQVGQQVCFESNLRVENQERAQPLASTRYQVIERTLTPSLYTIKYIYATDSHIDNALDKEEQREAKFQIVPAAQMLRPSEEDPIASISYHDPSITQVRVPAPEKVRARPNCGGLGGCALNGWDLRYTVKIVFKDGQVFIRRLSNLVSGDVPFFAAIVESCAEGYVLVDGRNLLVKECEFATDFVATSDLTQEKLCPNVLPSSSPAAATAMAQKSLKWSARLLPSLNWEREFRSLLPISNRQ